MWVENRGGDEDRDVKDQEAGRRWVGGEREDEVCCRDQALLPGYGRPTVETGPQSTCGRINVGRTESRCNAEGVMDE